MKHVSEIIWRRVDEALSLPPDPGDFEAEQVARNEDIGQRELYISLTNQGDGLRFELNELEEGRDRTDLSQRIKALDRERGEIALGHSAPLRGDWVFAGKGGRR